MLLTVLILMTTIQPVLNLHENVRPTAEKILLHTNQPGIIAAISPGPQPFLFYLGNRCVEVAKISELPPDTTYLLMSPQSWADEAPCRQGLHGVACQRDRSTIRSRKGQGVSSDRKSSVILGRPLRGWLLWQMLPFRIQVWKTWMPNKRTCEKVGVCEISQDYAQARHPS